jgi:hypothetical protein
MLNHRRFRFTYKHAFYYHQIIRRDGAKIDQPFSLPPPRSDE